MCIRDRFGVLLTELANAAAAVLLTVCAVSVVNTTVSHVRCPYYVLSLIHIYIAIFDRTWYGRVMVERLEGFCSENEWQRAYNEINEFERCV